MHRKALVWAVVLVAAGVWLSTRVMSESRAANDKPDASLERTRRQVRMLDDLYKTTVVLITDKYVEDKHDFPAGSAAVAIFAAMKEKGWHEVRLLDATGRPRRSRNAPQDGFERAAVEQLASGESYHEAVVVRDGQRYLRAATPVPVVSEKCILCHAHYDKAGPGEAIGALSYTIKIE